MVARASVVLVDTNVFGADLLRRGAPLAALYRPLLERVGPSCCRSRRWLNSGLAPFAKAGGNAGSARLDEQVARAEVVWAGPDLLAEYVALRVRCAQVGPASPSPITTPTDGSRPPRSDSGFR